MDEIKLLKYINRHDPGDLRRCLRLYDFFYHKEHLFIVCELLRCVAPCPRLCNAPPAPPPLQGCRRRTPH